MRDDTCGIFTLDATGLRGNKNGASGSTSISNDCWNTS
jgi:type IV pilus assembly protein PilE